MLEVLFGVVAGIVSSLGMGGGTILILLLTLFFNTDQHIAQATNLIFFIPTSITSILINAKKINWKISKEIIIFGIIGAIIGSIFASKIPSEKLKKIFGIFLLIIAIFQIYEIYVSYRKKKKTDNKIKEKNSYKEV